jgi:hypothetical protein
MDVRCYFAIAPLTETCRSHTVPRVTVNLSPVSLQPDRLELMPTIQSTRFYVDQTYDPVRKS